MTTGAADADDDDDDLVMGRAVGSEGGSGSTLGFQESKKGMRAKIRGGQIHEQSQLKWDFIGGDGSFRCMEDYG